MESDAPKRSPLDELAEAVQERGVWAGQLLGQLVAAGIGLRVAAAALDVGFYFLFSTALSCLVACAGAFGPGNFGEAVGVCIYILLESLGASMCLAGEIRNGRTFGKAIVGIQVIATDGANGSRRLRWALRSLPLFIVAGIALLRLLILFLIGKAGYRWSAIDESLAPYSLIVTLVVMLVAAFITKEGQAWYDRVAATYVARRVKVARGQGFEPIMRN